jgi:YhcH/YjgK/YiaL family protein
MFMNIQEYETRSASEVHFEKHAAHIDVQYLISGEEQIGWASNNESLVPDEDMFADRDIAFFHHVQSSVSILMNAGRYVILFPDDLHRPCVHVKPSAPAAVRKAVIKIHVDLLK